MKRPGFAFPKRIALAVLFISALVGSAFLVAGCSSEPEEDPIATYHSNMAIYFKDRTGTWYHPPHTTEDLVEELLVFSEVIVVGAVVASLVDTGVLKTHSEVDNERIDQWLAEDYPPPRPYSPHTDYLIDVEKVILDDGIIASGRPLTLRMHKRPDKRSEVDHSPFVLSLLNIGDRRLFTLLPKREGEIYYLSSWWSHFVIDGDKVTYSDDLRTPIGFKNTVKPEDFIKSLEEAVSQRN